MPVMGAVPELPAVNDGIVRPGRLLLAPRPMAVLLLVQVNVVPDTGPVRFVTGTVLPGQ